MGGVLFFTKENCFIWAVLEKILEEKVGIFEFFVIFATIAAGGLVLFEKRGQVLISHEYKNKETYCKIKAFTDKDGKYFYSCKTKKGDL